MKKRLFLIKVLTLVLLTTVLSGCSKLDSKDTLSKNTTEKKELVIAIGGEPENGFDPTTGWGRYGSPLFQSTLFVRDEKLNVVNDLASGYKVREDGLVWSVSIRQDAKFSDGKPLTVEDVKFTFETAAKSGSIVDLSVLKEIKTSGNYSIQFILNKPQSTFITNLLSLGIVPKHGYGKDYASNPVGSGPYKLVQWNKGQQLIVETNLEYYGQKPYFNKITFLFLNEDAAFAASKVGTVDISYVIPTFAKQEVEGMKLFNIKSVDNRGIAFPHLKSGEKDSEGNIIGNDVTSDIAICKAINIAISRQSLVDGILEGFGTPAYTVCDNLPWWNEDTVIKDGNIEEAKKILADAGWKDRDGDGILEKNSVKAEFKLLYPSSDQTRQFLSIAVADMMKPLGINIIPEGQSWDKLEKNMYSNAVLFGWGSHDPLEIYNIYSSDNKGVGFYNTIYYSNKVVDEYMEKALSSISESEAIEYWKKAQWDGSTGLSAKGDAPWAWLVNLDHLYLVNEKLDIGVQKVQPHDHGWPITDNIVQWKWKEN